MTENTSTTCSSTVWMSPFRRVGTLVVPYFDDQQRVEVGEERRMSLNNYGRSVLEKYGWKEGKGLGKHENGIFKPIRASYKFDSAGLGYDHGREFSDNWWDLAFKTAASSFAVENSKDGVSIRKVDDSELPIKRSLKSAEMYSSFVKSETENNEEKNDVHLASRLFSEETFKACGHCTGHKAARHGLKMNGKLQRLKAQERSLLQRKDDTHKQIMGDDDQLLRKVTRKRTKKL